MEKREKTKEQDPAKALADGTMSRKMMRQTNQTTGTTRPLTHRQQKGRQ